MNDDPDPLATDAREPSDARFTMRGLLIGMALAVAVAAMAGAFLRRLPAEEQSRLFLFWMFWLLATIAVAAWQVRRRIKAERLAGRTLLRLAMRSESWLLGRTLIVWPILIVAMLYYSSRLITELASPSSFIGVVPFVFMIWPTTQLLPDLFWGNHIRFCENGILSAQQFVPWTHVMKRRWNDTSATTLELRGIDVTGNTFQLVMPVPFEQRLETQSLLDERCTGLPFLAEGTSMSLGQMPLSTVLRTKHYRWHLWGVLVSSLCALGVFYSVVVYESGVREFDQSFVVGIFASSIGMFWRRQQDGQKAGTPFVRLFGRRDLLGFIAAVAAALGLYLVGTGYAWPYALPIYAAGLGCAFAIVHAVSYYFLTQLDLCENGVVVRGASYWPWQKAQLVSWDRENNRRLVLARGWRRVVGFAAPEQRDAVEALLNETLPDWKSQAEQEAQTQPP